MAKAEREGPRRLVRESAEVTEAGRRSAGNRATSNVDLPEEPAMARVPRSFSDPAFADPTDRFFFDGSMGTATWRSSP